MEFKASFSHLITNNIQMGYYIYIICTADISPGFKMLTYIFNSAEPVKLT